MPLPSCEFFSRGGSSGLTMPPPPRMCSGNSNPLAMAHGALRAPPPATPPRGPGTSMPAKMCALVPADGEVLPLTDGSADKKMARRAASGLISMPSFGPPSGSSRTGAGRHASKRPGTAKAPVHLAPLCEGAPSLLRARHGPPTKLVASWRDSPAEASPRHGRDLPPEVRWMWWGRDRLTQPAVCMRCVHRQAGSPLPRRKKIPVSVFRARTQRRNACFSRNTRPYSLGHTGNFRLARHLPPACGNGS